MRLTPNRLVAVYVIVAAAWILLSDQVVGALFPGGAGTTISILKGWGFVAVTGILLLLLVQRLVRTSERERAAAMQLAHEANEARQDLATARERYEHLVEWSPLSIVSADPEGTVLTWNPAAERLWGVPARDAVGSFAPWVLADERPRFLALLRDVAAGARPIGEIKTRHRADGSEVQVRVANTAFTDIRGEVRIIFVAEDVTREQEANRRVAEILARIDDGFVAFDRDWRYTYVNERAGELLGRRPEDLVGKVYHEEFPEAVGTPFQIAYARAMEEQVALIVEEHYAPWDRWFENRIYPSGDGIAVLFNEITDRRRAEQTLRESERRMRTALEELPLLGVILDTEGRITFCNDFLLDLTGWTREEVLGQEWFELFIPPDIRADIRGPRFARAIATGEIAIHHENDIVTRSGERRLVAWNNTILRDAAGVVTGTASLGDDITERRRADEALLETKAVLEEAEEQAKLGSWQLEVATGRGSWSRQMFRLFGRDPAQGAPDLPEYLDAIHPDDRDTVQDAVLRMTQGQDPTVFVYRTNPERGPLRYLIPTWHTVLDDAGRPVRYEGTVLDVTERELAERELRATSEVLHRTGELARVGGWTLEVPSMELSWTEEIDRIHEGAAAGSPTLELALGFYPPDSRPLLEAAIQAAITAATPWDLELRVITVSGRRIWVRSIGSPVVEDGTVVRLVGATQDITERKAAQEEARVLLERLTLATQAAGVGIFDWDLVTDAWYGSPSYFTTLGYEPEPESSDWRPWLDRYHPDDRDAVATRIHAALSGSEAPYAYEARVRHADGTYRWVSVEGRVVEREDGGRPRRMLGVRQDITDRVALETRLRQAQKMETMGQFASILAHDLRSYLNAISWSVDLLAREIDEADPRRPDVDQIRTTVDGGLGMIRNVLDFARPNHRGRGVTDLRAHLAQVGGILGRLVGTSVAVETDLPQELPAVAIEPAAVTQVLFNLAANARDAMPDGGVFRLAAGERTVTPADTDDAYAEALPPGRYVRVQVSDTGEGMDAATAHRAFDAFHTTKEADGIGLGLASVYLVVARAGGAVTVSSEPGEGTTFTIDLPVAG